MLRKMLSDAILAELQAAVDSDGLIVERNQLQTYECDGLMALRALPAAVALPRSASQVQNIVRVCARYQIPFVARGAGTGLSGGALPDAAGIVISFARMTRVLAVDIPNQRIKVEPGVINAHVTQRGAARGYFYATRPVFAIGVHHRRQRGGECRRRALPQIRFHDHPRSGTRCGAAPQANW